MGLITWDELGEPDYSTAEDGLVIALSRDELAALGNGLGQAIEHVDGTTDWAAYQRTHADSTECELTSTTRDEIWADGLRADPHAGIALEAKYVNSPGRGAMYEGALPRPLQNMLMKGFDGEMPRDAAAITDQGNPITRLEIITSTEQAGQ